MMPNNCGCGNFPEPFDYFMNITPTLPEFYYDVKSSEQRIKSMCLEISKVIEFLKYLAEKIGLLEGVKPEELQAAVDILNKKIADLEQKINTLTSVSQDWNICEGKATDSVEAHRDHFKLSTIYGFTVARLSAAIKTVDDLANSGLNCAGIACFGSKFDEMHDLKVPKKYMVGGYNE